MHFATEKCNTQHKVKKKAKLRKIAQLYSSRIEITLQHAIAKCNIFVCKCNPLFVTVYFTRKIIVNIQTEYDIT